MRRGFLLAVFAAFSTSGAAGIALPPAEGWVPQGASPPAADVEFAGRCGLRFPCDFHGNNAKRVYWDAQVNWDLSSLRGLALTLHCENRSALGGVTWYFGSGGGWYAVSLDMGQQGRGETWIKTQALKLEALLSGEAAGWRRIDRVRLAVWRGTDANGDLFVGDVWPLRGRPELVLVRPEPVGVREPSPYAATFDQALDAWGLAPRVVADRDLGSDTIAGAKVIVLPHNTRLPEKAEAAVTSFLGSQGKLLACFGLPPKVAKAGGIAQQGYLAAEKPGQFAEIRCASEALPGAPAAVRQASWNIVRIGPETEGEVLAEWYSADGMPTGQPAVAATPKAVVLSHVLLRDDWAHKKRLALSMLARVWPEAGPLAAENRIETMGTLGRYASFAEAHRAILTTAGAQEGVRAKLEAALAKREEARQLIEAERPFLAIDAAEQADVLTREAFARAQAPKRGEFRAFWCHDAYGIAGMTWDETAEVLADNGFTALLVNACYAGAAYFESDVIPRATDWRGDALAECLAACRRHGLECHLWAVCWRLGKTSGGFAAKMRAANRMAVDRDGKASTAWLSPAQGANRDLMVRALAGAALRYPVDGIHLDYIRFENERFCYSAGAREAFEEAAGLRVTGWPQDVGPGGPQHAAWQDFRREAISRAVRELHAALQGLDRSVKLSAAVWPNLPLDRENLGQDWGRWCAEGLLDFVCPMSYTESNAQFASWVRLQREWSGGVSCCPGIGLTTWTRPGDTVRLVEQVEILREANLPGFVVFSLNHTALTEVVPLLGMGLTRP